ncbi:hypothetical protein EVAR_6981_1 [Eumeta japonica]|uniref:Uncharacterized protein n=1 Tax=Eumeta variegata TaxID=151549 RepID=A0A4C1THP2_EUMVA|nr:hypothetical protein EVAR_6981_1 [Eumeta japonica]
MHQHAACTTPLTPESVLVRLHDYLLHEEVGSTELRKIVKLDTRIRPDGALPGASRTAPNESLIRKGPKTLLVRPYSEQRDGAGKKTYLLETPKNLKRRTPLLQLPDEFSKRPKPFTRTDTNSFENGERVEKIEKDCQTNDGEMKNGEQNKNCGRCDQNICDAVRNNSRCNQNNLNNNHNNCNGDQNNCNGNQNNCNGNQNNCNVNRNGCSGSRSDCVAVHSCCHCCCRVSKVCAVEGPSDECRCPANSNLPLKLLFAPPNMLSALPVCRIPPQYMLKAKGKDSDATSTLTKVETGRSHFTIQRWTATAIQWKRPEGERNVDEPIRRWADDIIQVTGKNWMRSGMDRELWKKLEKALTHAGIHISID